MINYNDSVTLAKQLRKQNPAILGIELFGSVLRNGQGRDADFLILVANELAKAWWTKEREQIRVRWPDMFYGQLWIVKKFLPFFYDASIFKRRDIRLKSFADMLNVDLSKLTNPEGQLPNFEVFLVPVGWRTERELNLNVMREITDLMDDRNTLGFFKRVAKEATRTD